MHLRSSQYYHGPPEFYLIIGAMEGPMGTSPLVL
jgi:hypothetical protein